MDGYGATCGGKEGISPSPEVVKLGKKLTNNIINDTPIEPQELKAALSITLGPIWMKLHPNHTETIPTNPKDLLSDITPNAFMQQFNAVLNWYASNWSGVCSQLPNISKPTLIITGTDDISLSSSQFLNSCTKNPWSMACTDPGSWARIDVSISR